MITKLVFNSYYFNFIGVSRSVYFTFGLQAVDLVKGLEGGPVRQGGPHQVGIHLSELGHILNHAKVVQIRTRKFNCSDCDQNKHKVNLKLGKYTL